MRNTPARRAARSILPGDRAGLARELQRELRRVGCYDGEINGTWTPAARRAMKTFTDSVNASLPVDQPDYILLTLVQGRQERVCGAPCSAGQGMAEDGRCLPNAVIARAAKKATTTASRSTHGREADNFDVRLVDDDRNGNRGPADVRGPDGVGRTQERHPAGGGRGPFRSSLDRAIAGSIQGIQAADRTDRAPGRRCRAPAEGRCCG